MSIPVPFIGTKNGAGLLREVRESTLVFSSCSRAPLPFFPFDAFSPYCVYTSVARNTVLHTAVRIFSPISAHIAAVVCSSLPVKGTPQYQLQPLLSFRGSITSQTCPVLLPPLWNLSYPWEDHETFGVFYRLKIFLPSMSTHIPSTDGEYKATLAAHISSPPPICLESVVLYLRSDGRPIQGTVNVIPTALSSVF